MGVRRKNKENKAAQSVSEYTKSQKVSEPVHTCITCLKTDNEK